MNIFVIFSGLMGSDAKVSIAKDGTEFLMFSVAVKGFEAKQQTTTWITVFAFKKVGSYYPTQSIVDSLIRGGKGRYVTIKGEMRKPTISSHDGTSITLTVTAVNLIAFPKRSDTMGEISRDENHQINDNFDSGINSAPEIW